MLSIVRTGRQASIRGMSLIELIVGIAIVAIALAFGVPSFGEWMMNTQIRSTAESMQSGLLFARAEAVRRNTTVRFQFTSTMDANCALSTSGPNWVVNMGASVTPASACNTTISDSDTPFILQVSPVVSTSSRVSMTAARTTLAFNGLGRLAATTNPTATASQQTIQIGSQAGTCIANSGSLRCLNLIVTPAGEVRMCDPSITNASGTAGPIAC